MKYIFAEKPSQAKAYADAFTIEKREKTHITLKPCNTFPKGAVITWGIGHLVGLQMPGDYNKEWARWSLDHLPILPDTFRYKPKKETMAQYRAVQGLFKRAEKERATVIVATDIDREGSLIFHSTYQLIGHKAKELKRLWINSLEVDEIRKGFRQLQPIDQDLLKYEEAKTRQIADWIVGMNASQLFTLLLKQKGLNTTLSVGRVQSPTVYMVYQRQKEMENFVSKPFYELFADFTHENGAYSGKAKVKEEQKETVLKLLDEKGLSDLTDDQAVIKDVSKQLKRTPSPRLHSLSTLQTKANRIWKYSPAKVLQVMQSLYEKKIVTYPRTDCNYITENEFAYLSENVRKYQGLISVSFEPKIRKNKRYVDNAKVKEHYAIIPTQSIPSEKTLGGLSNEERNIYFEILKTTLAMFHDDYKYEETTIVTDVKTMEFFTKGRVGIEKGWRSLFSNEKMESGEKTSPQNALPQVLKGDRVSSALEVREGHTTPPKPFTEGGLIQLMKTAGKMVDDESESEILKEIEGIGTEATRSSIIETIKKNGYIEVKKNIVSVTKKGTVLCEAIEGNLLSSPSMTAKWESYLKKIGTGQGSQDFFLKNIVKFIQSTIDEAPLKINQQDIQTLVNEQKDVNYIGNCPICNSGKMVDRKTFYGCTEYKKGCSFSISKMIAGKKLTNKNIKDLLEKKVTAKIKGFKSRAGKVFEARLFIQNQKVAFQFESK
ncbi:DNA topoisomerase III [Ammoniphilus oxalaticus]|uniref:DNA topoisomerase n=1 Tax=Ammoniphilus oxalaticus TaxID=66863 RepID=A0A419SQB0_9BACL|nr:type IA DNA topoisomerase [Ammoniphilus oxalaticus]RKD26511.1 DNA topoisomerase III [Ammoniphilus oxalaticus]